MGIHIDRYEKIWIAIALLSMAVLFATVTIAGTSDHNMMLVGSGGYVDPRTAAQTAPFDQPGVYEIAPGKYEVIMVAKIWSFAPSEITIPKGAEVTFKIVSVDVTHGMYLDGTNMNVMILPGQITESTVTFNTAGEYMFLCHEYCGAGHQTMAGKVIVAP
jgi:cytochrome c oxidase subunit 2